MLKAGWTYEYIASLDTLQLIAAVETYARMKEEDINILASLLGVKKRGRK